MLAKMRWMSGRGVWLGLGLCVVFWAGCAPKKPSAGDSRRLEVDESVGEVDDSAVIVARVNGEEITKEEFERRIEGLAPYARVRLQSPERRREFLRSVVQFEVMADEAERQGFGDRPQVRQAMKETMVRLFVADSLRDEVSMRDIDDEMVERFYQERLEELKEAERRRLARVWFADQGAAQVARERFLGEELGDDPERIGRLFQRFAFRYSEDRKTGDQGGELGWVERGEADGVRAGVFEVDAGAVQGPVEADGGWELWMVVEVEAEQVPLLEDVVSEIRTKIFEERREQAQRAMVEELMSRAEIELFEDSLDGLEAPSARIPARLEELPRVEP